jgi:hypothetical protein
MTNNIGSEEKLGNEEELPQEVIYEEYDTRGEILLHCYNAIAATEMIDTFIKREIKQKERVRRKSLDIIEYYVNEIHAEIFDVEEDAD